jgi:hypothetical protein
VTAEAFFLPKVSGVNIIQPKDVEALLHGLVFRSRVTIADCTSVAWFIRDYIEHFSGDFLAGLRMRILCEDDSAMPKDWWLIVEEIEAELRRRQ